MLGGDRGRGGRLRGLGIGLGRGLKLRIVGDRGRKKRLGRLGCGGGINGGNVIKEAGW